MLGTLGIPRRVAYASRNFASGIVGIEAWVKKPNGAPLGMYGLEEEPGLAFKGIYSFFLPTTQLMPEGEYLISIMEPGNDLRVVQQIHFTLPVVPPGIDINEVALTGVIRTRPRINGRVTLGQSLRGVINKSVLSGVLLQEQSINGKVKVGSLVGTIKNGELKGTLKECEC